MNNEQMIKTQTPTVSVVMSVFKEPIDWMRQSIDSILHQTFTDFEFIIVNDCPDRDENRMLLDEYQKHEQRIVIIENKENIGLTRSLNKGLSVSRGKYIARMDADDIAFEDRFQMQLDYLNKHPEIDLCHCAFEHIDDASEHLGDRYLTERERHPAYFFLLDTIAHPTVMFRRHLMEKRTPLYNEEYKNAQDYELWSYLFLKGATFGYIEKKLLKYRLSKSQITRKENCTQVDNGRRIRRKLIYNYLLQKECELESQLDAQGVLKELKKRPNIEFEDINIKIYIKYLSYFTCSRNIGKRYLLYYLFDKDSLITKLPIKYSFYVLLAPALKNRWKIMEM